MCCTPTRPRVSIHAPVRGATAGCIAGWANLSRFQSTPPCGGRPPCRPRPGSHSAVSIHAPVRGATPTHDKNPLAFAVSIHAPVRGATAVSNARRSSIFRFNPRPRAGGDGPEAACQAQGPIVSIHAPVRGATFRPLGMMFSIHRFNPRPRAGGDRRTRCASPLRPAFQSTPPCGGRHAVPDLVQRLLEFQSTPPCGGRPRPINARSTSPSFQSTPPCGGRRKPALI